MKMKLHDYRLYIVEGFEYDFLLKESLMLAPSPICLQSKTLTSFCCNELGLTPSVELGRCGIDDAGRESDGDAVSDNGRERRTPVLRPSLDSTSAGLMMGIGGDLNA
jgi:hypothetical protein